MQHLTINLKEDANKLHEACVIQTTDFFIIKEYNQERYVWYDLLQSHNLSFEY